MTYLKDFDTSNRQMATVIETHRITPENCPEVRSIKLQLSDSQFSWYEGQNIGVLVPGPHEFGHDQHFRLYSIANSQSVAENTVAKKNSSIIELCVRRCFYVDEFSGEQEAGIASNYLCNLKQGDEINLTGPYGDAFKIPKDPDSNLLMIGSGTGIAPFRAFVQHLYQNQSDRLGKVMLFYGANNGAEHLYHNEQLNDLEQYYNQKTYQSFVGLSQRPWMNNEDHGLGDVLEENIHTIWELLEQPNTYVYIAGLENTVEKFNDILAKQSGSAARWQWMLEEMKEQKRWAELIYS
ncbi:MAG: oxidoreductase [Gammaproteobacteria bacterium]|nr:oxidoreductase [Gammaproteobacteria bacterium]